MAIRIVSWNVRKLDEPWRILAGMDVDVVLAQEARKPPPDVADRIRVPETLWRIGGKWRRPFCATIAAVSDRVDVRFRALRPLNDATGDDLAVSHVGALAIADVTDRATRESVTVASMYGVWEQPIGSAKGKWKFADASIHRLLSDLSACIETERRHRLIAAGDLNVLFGYGEHGKAYWKGRYDSIWARADAIGIPFAGPRLPNGIAARVRPAELPADSPTVPTYRTRQADPASATRQLDFVLASRHLHPRLSIRALNSDDEWGPSDHCRVLIELQTG